MESLYQMIGISRQAHFKRIRKNQENNQKVLALVEKAKAIRAEHPRIGCRKLYHQIQPEGLGRDKSEKALLSNGFRTPIKRNYHRTTYAGLRWYDNLVDNLELNGPNQLWVSDITYLPLVKGEHYYLTLILDVYSKVIKGWSLSQNMTAEQTVLKAYKKALVSIPKSDREGLIFHSDKGSQYGCTKIDQMHHRHNVNPSMGGKAWENPHAESLNGILKNEYLFMSLHHLSFNQVHDLVKRSIYKYNHKRPHGSLNQRKPIEFEKNLHQISDEEKHILVINYKQ